MRAVVQRVTSAQVIVEGEVTGKIDAGLCVLVGVGKDDAEADATALADKVINLRIFEDDAGKMNQEPARRRAVRCWRCHSSRCTATPAAGRRPSFVQRDGA